MLSCSSPPWLASLLHCVVHVGCVLGVLAYLDSLVLRECGGPGLWEDCKGVFKPGAWEGLSKSWDYQLHSLNLFIGEP